ncbi:MAG: thiol-disulfide oxidoreductase DCC family protein [Cyclobacteriaceae bacterium]|nr:thiol-disulfide oxidoreductase DCC family protein [Cyclobacteriaceae bacterium]
MGADHSINKVILFDGVCNLCAASVTFVIQRDPSARFRFASLQSSYGQEKLINAGFKSHFDTIVLLKDGKVYTRSDAALEVARDLKGLWPALYIFKIVPAFIRNGIYNWIATNRYKWFGKKESCMIPTPDLKARFID